MIDFDEDDDAGPAPEMNTTPLIDVLLVLLIMIIVTIPLRPHLTELLQAARGAAPVRPPVVARLDMNAEGVVRWDGSPVDQTEFEIRLDALARAEEPPEVHLRVDGEAAYGHVVRVLSVIRRRERIKFGLVGSGG